MTRWNEETTLKFVKLYRHHQCLWNVALFQYRNKSARHCALLSIVREIGVEGFGIEEAKLKIKSLRSTYLHELNKIKTSERTGNGKDYYVSNLKWFPVMHAFINDVRREKRNHANNSKYSSDEDNTREQYPESNGAAPPPAPCSKEDQCESFGKYIALQLKYIPKENLSMVQQEIQNVVTRWKFRLQERKYNIENNNSYMYHHQSSSHDAIKYPTGCFPQDDNMLAEALSNAIRDDNLQYQNPENDNMMCFV